MKNIISVTLKLLIITVISAIALGAVNYITAEPIAEQAAAAAQEARQSAYPEAASFEALYDPSALPDVTLESLLGTDEINDDYGIIKTVYTALDADGNPVGIVAGVVTKGFNSGLNLTIGLASDGTIKGVIVGDNTETAGLGAKAKEDWFQNQYIGKQSPLTVVKAGAGDDEVQAITGATITSRGVTNAVNTVSEFYAALNGGAK
jgi:Na+-translocating ferredoxin:NAD+ oxidoreductase subunit G